MPQKLGDVSRKRQSQRIAEARRSKRRMQWANDLIVTTKRTILTLPTEISLLIIGHLQIPWHISLALTCKCFMEFTFPGQALPRLEGKDLVEFLSTLQKDIPGIYFCFCCNKLRLLNAEQGWEEHPESNGRNLVWQPHLAGNRHVKLPPSFFAFKDQSSISFMEVYLVMNRHLYGTSKGISLQNLERSASFEGVFEIDRCQRCWTISGCNYGKRDYFPQKYQAPHLNLEVPRERDAWRFLFSSIPKIVDNELLIARFYTVIGPRGPEEHLKKILDAIGLPICSHLTCSAYPYCCNLMRNLPKRHLRQYPFIKSNMPYRKDDGKEFEFSPERDSCLLCSTDYDISLNKDADDNEWNLSLSIYHSLGSCKSPDDQLWKYLSSDLPDNWVLFPLPGLEDILPEFAFEYTSPRVEPISPELEEIKSRYLKLDPGRNRRKWHSEI